MANKFNRARFDRLLRAIPENSRRELREALGRAAEVVTASQRAFAPVDDGKLQASIRHDPVDESEGKIAVEIRAGGAGTTRRVRNGTSATYDYSLGVEFGTNDTPAQPFFFPGWRTNKKRVKSRVSRAVKKAVKQST